MSSLFLLVRSDSRLVRTAESLALDTSRYSSALLLAMMVSCAWIWYFSSRR